jgi:hypothetical protein
MSTTYYGFGTSKQDKTVSLMCYLNDDSPECSTYRVVNGQWNLVFNKLQGTWHIAGAGHGYGRIELGQQIPTQYLLFKGYVPKTIDGVCITPWEYMLPMGYMNDNLNYPVMSFFRRMVEIVGSLKYKVNRAMYAFKCAKHEFSYAYKTGPKNYEHITDVGDEVPF